MQVLLVWDIRGVLKILEHSNINHLIHIVRDRILMRHNFDQPYKLAIEIRSKWTSSEPQLKTETLTWYTYGSRIKGVETNFRISESNYHLKVHMLLHSNVFPTSSNLKNLEIPRVKRCWRLYIQVWFGI